MELLFQYMQACGYRQASRLGNVLLGTVPSHVGRRLLVALKTLQPPAPVVAMSLFSQVTVPMK
jgi:hypothetical protein